MVSCSSARCIASSVTGTNRQCDITHSFAIVINNLIYLFRLNELVECINHDRHRLCNIRLTPICQINCILLAWLLHHLMVYHHFSDWRTSLFFKPLFFHDNEMRYERIAKAGLRLFFLLFLTSTSESAVMWETWSVLNRMKVHEAENVLKTLRHSPNEAMVTLFAWTTNSYSMIYRPISMKPISEWIPLAIPDNHQNHNNNINIFTFCNKCKF